VIEKLCGTESSFVTVIVSFCPAEPSSSFGENAKSCAVIARVVFPVTDAVSPPDADPDPVVVAGGVAGGDGDGAVVLELDVQAASSRPGAAAPASVSERIVRVRIVVPFRRG